MTRKSLPHRPRRATDLLGIIHTNVCDPLRHVSRQDQGGEYISQEFKDYLKANGIVQQLTPPYTPQHNGVFEKSKNCTLLDMVRSMMNLTTLPLSFWDYALESVINVRINQKSQENSQKRASTDTRIRRVQKEAKESKPKPENQASVKSSQRKDNHWSTKVNKNHNIPF
ncbi:retrotransposon protein, putative, ty1-copia subclass [Tanacetum coccineum]